MNIFGSLLPGRVPTSLASESELLIQRERILQAILLGGVVFGGIALATSVHLDLQRGMLWAVLLNGFVLVGVTAVTIARNLPFHLRVYSLLLMLYVLGTSGFFENGLSGDARIFLMGMIFLSGIFLGLRGALASLGLSVLTMLFVGFLMSTGRLPLPSVEAMATSGNFPDWIVGGAVLVLISVAATLSLSGLIADLQKSLHKSKELSGELENERDSLGVRVQERTADVERRLGQIRTAAEITRNISSMLEPAALIQQVVDLVHDRFDLYYVGVFLIDVNDRFAVLSAGTGEAGRTMISSRHRLEINDSSMIGWSIAHKKPRIALDVGTDSVRFNNPYLPLTHSEMALPLVAHDHALGALTIQSSQPNAFDENDVVVLQIVADGLAIALENARLFKETEASLEEIRALHRQYLKTAWSAANRSQADLSYTYESPAARSSSTRTNSIDFPLHLRDMPMGHISVETDKTDLSEDELAYIEAITTQTALALENARLLEESRERIQREQLLNDMAAQFSRSVNVETVLKTAIQELGRLPSVSEVTIQLSEPAPENGNGKEH